MLQLRGHEYDLTESCQLHLTVAKDDPHQLSELLSQSRYKEVINSPSGWGVPETPLRCAASHGFLNCLKILLDNGAEVDRLDVKAQTPLFTAVSAGHLECVKALLQAGANPCGSMYNNCSPILTAAQNGNDNILTELLKYRAEANVKSKRPGCALGIKTSTGPLYISAIYDHLHCFKTLLLHGADPDYNCTDQKLLQRIKRPRPVLEICLKHGLRVDFVKLLIEFGANVHLVDEDVIKSVLNNEAAELLMQEKGRPRALMSECRLTIRNHLMRIRKTHLIGQLEIPQALINYLQYEP
ncbi:ankyrin repeat and SOCS box-containing 12 L homeolog [Xenopus laevis]|uniref:Ankyrin repeat and SOCS box-containing 12 L homeolog n=2 Tax=Xenopus laevis TaxID=8355 RepID=Q66L19_XENLA|nr:ankyrin repeat and SOCS box-containing 12 L homeolog [Xenopus laevis]AAH78478.1 MGC85239 protein [Xenopus laevis]OCT67443.1 hypothetical protein XELAEV_18038739mg [Xenopus laevis]